MRLLLVEDDRALADELQARLEAAGYAVDRAGDGEDARYLGQTEDYDLVILDLGLPRISGIQVLEDWRGEGRTMPVLILTARDTWREKVLGLKVGADDYLTKPFHPEELLARIGALLRRAYGRALPEIATAAFTLDEDLQCVVRADGTRVQLTGTEFRLLRYFMLWIGRTVAEQFVASRLAHDAEALIAGLDLDSREIAGPLPPVYNQPFSGHYYLVRFDDGRVSRSRSLWDHQIQVEILAPGLTVMERHDGPRGQRLLLWRAGFEKQGVAFTVAVAEDMTQLLDTLWRLLWVGVGLSLCGTLTLLFVQRWLLRRGFGQVAAVRTDLQRLDAGEIDRLRENVPEEIQPLVRELNQFIDAWRNHLQRSRQALGNLAHALKSPINLILLHHPETLNDPAAEQAIRMRGLVDRELRRARLAGEGSPGRRFRPHDDVPDLVAGIQTLYKDRHLEISSNIDTPERLPFDEEDMLELLGNLLDNAAKWSRRRVRLNLRWEEGMHLLVEDDGRVPQDDGRNQQIEPGCPRALSLEGSIPNFTETVEEYGTGQRILGLPHVDACLNPSCILLVPTSLRRAARESLEHLPTDLTT